MRPIRGYAVSLNPIPNELFNRYRIEHMRVGESRVSFEVLHQDGECHIRHLDGDIEITSQNATVE